MEYFQKAKEWINMFTSLGSSCQGFLKERVTPYMHSMVYHVPQFMTLHKGTKKFSGQGVEKKNDDCRHLHLQKSNKWDAPKDVLLALKRQEHLNSQKIPKVKSCTGRMKSRKSEGNSFQVNRQRRLPAYLRLQQKTYLLVICHLLASESNSREWE